MTVNNDGPGYVARAGRLGHQRQQWNPIPLADGGVQAGRHDDPVDQLDHGRQPGTNYTRADVTVTDPTGTSATATATVATASFRDHGQQAGVGLRSGGIHEFVDTLPGLGPTGVNNLGQYVSVANAAANQNIGDGWSPATWKGPTVLTGSARSRIAKMHTDLPATTLRGYVQLTTSVTPWPVLAPNRTTDPRQRCPGCTR